MNAIEIVRNYLGAMEARDLAAAQALLADNFVMQFPGSGPMRTLPELLTCSAPRYRWVRKRYQRFDVCSSDDSTATAQIVYCSGELYGQWPDGSEFDHIRFIDRFVISQGRINRQDVWNDIAEQRSRLAT